MKILHVVGFFPRSFTLSSMIHFKLVFVCGMRWGSKFAFFSVDILVSAPFVEMAIIPLLNYLDLFVENQWTIHVLACLRTPLCSSTPLRVSSYAGKAQGFVVSLEISNASLSAWFVFRTIWHYRSFVFPDRFSNRSVPFPQRRPLGFWQCWIYRSLWRQWTA